MTIKLFKLISGEEVIGEFGEAMMHGKGVPSISLGDQLTKPCQVLEMVNNGQLMLVLRPYFRGGVCDVLWIKPEHVIQSINPSDALVDAYRQQTTGLVVAR